VTCGQLAVDATDGLNSAKFWPVGDTYGVNTFIVKEVPAGTIPEATLPIEGWVATPNLWWAMKMDYDQDPQHLSDANPFIIWYVPPKIGNFSWSTKTGAKNDGTCPASDSIVYGTGRHRCLGQYQLDEQAPGLIKGRTYLFRILMMEIVPTEGNYITSCYQMVATY
jgi:hypothetical protein